MPEVNFDALRLLEDTVAGDPKDPFIKGTNVEVYRIAALLAGGATLDEVKEDYPSLNATQIENAWAYAQAIPMARNPYPPQSFKRATKALDLHLLDELLTQEDEKAHLE